MARFGPPHLVIRRSRQAARSCDRTHEDRGNSRADARRSRRMILVDTNVLLDVLQDDLEWADWSQLKLEAASATEHLAINPITYSELSISFARIEELEAVDFTSRLHLTRPAAHITRKIPIVTSLSGSPCRSTCKRG